MGKSISDKKARTNCRLKLHLWGKWSTGWKQVRHCTVCNRRQTKREKGFGR